jgi:hypothetical protein
MKRRLELWALVGFLVAASWVVVNLAIPMWREPVLLGLARLTCPIVNIGFALHFGVKWYWVVVTNAAAYALIGSLVEALRLSRHRFQEISR